MKNEQFIAFRPVVKGGQAAFSCPGADGKTLLLQHGQRHQQKAFWNRQ